ncbi:MAG: AAA family ATPase [Pseudomonadota bacterium]
MERSNQRSDRRRNTSEAARAVLERKTVFFENAELCDLIKRATEYMRAGVCVHFSGSAGIGKSSLAFRVAENLGRPISLMSGNEWLTAQDFIGREAGSTTSTVVDHYIQSVRRTEKRVTKDWRASVLAASMAQGHTLIYDEFTRATPEANATLLSVLEEGILVSADQADAPPYLEAHPEFRVILTSNAKDYLGVNPAPDALLDRVLTMPMAEPSVETLAGIASLRTGADLPLSMRIVEIVSKLRHNAQNEKVSTLRTAMLIARIAAARAGSDPLSDASLSGIAADVLIGRGLVSNVDEVASAFGRETRAA